MKSNCLIFMLLLLLAITVQLPAQQSASSNDTNNKQDFSKFGVLVSPSGSPSSTNTAATNTSRASEFDDLIPHATNGAANTFVETKAKAEKGDAIAQFKLGCF